MYKSTVSIAFGIALFFTCIFAYSAQATVVSANEQFASTIQPEFIGTAIAYTDTLTTTITVSDTEVIFQGLAEAVRSAEILRFRGVDGRPISIYDPAKFAMYESEVQILAAICPGCEEPECTRITCPIPCLFPCCNGTIPTRGIPCMIAQTSALEIDSELLKFSTEVTVKFPEQIIEAAEYFRKYQ